ncbi:MAG: hypothetical protein HYS61_08470 [Acidobacteria bacterium]|nr:hypothetical protein [Acidobacteriota bacterium]
MTESASNEPGGAPGPASGPTRGSVALVAVTLALLAALAWALKPDRPDFKPAPLEPPPEDCPKVQREFLPSNVTEILEPSLGGLTPARKNRALYRLNMEPCTCGCSLSIAACRVHNLDCKISKELAEKIIAEVRAESETKRER